MKKLYFVYSLLFTISLNLKAQQYDYMYGIDTITFEEFSPYILMDTSSSNVWQIAPPQKEILNQAVSPTHVIITDSINSYPAGAHSYFDLILTPENTYEYPGLIFLRFEHKICSDSGLDGGYITYSCDLGETWLNVRESDACYWWPEHPGYGWEDDYTNLYWTDDTLYNGEPGFSGCMENWEMVYVDFYYNPLEPPKSDLNETDTMLIRFNFISDSIDVDFDGWMIDDIETFAADIGSNTDFLDKALFSIYPNPSRDNLNILLDEYHSKLEVIVFDHRGNEVLKRSHPGEASLKIDVEHLASGLYFLHVTSESKSLGLEKILVSH
jgi:hypothetical protein